MNLTDALSGLIHERAAKYVANDPRRLASLPDLPDLTDAQRRKAQNLATILAAATAPTPRRNLMDRPEALVQWIAVTHWSPEQEIMGAAYLDTRHCLIAAEAVFRGTLTRAAVEPRPILRRGLELHAAGFILWHHHPSGDPSPSAEDLAFTRRLADAAEIVGVRLVDHIIVGDAYRYASLRRQGGF